MNILYLSKKVDLAITVSEGVVEVWGSQKYPEDKLRVFVKNGVKKLLASDKGYSWNRERKEAKNCYYATLRFGEYPYGSWFIAIRIDKITGKVTKDFFDTEINFRGILPIDKWREACKES